MTGTGCVRAAVLGIEAERIEQTYDWLVRHHARADGPDDRDCGTKEPLSRLA
jgi:hypothetical protein